MNGKGFLGTNASVLSDISLILGICIWIQWPESSFWFMGMFIGIALVFRGWMWVSVALAARRLTAPAP